MEHQCGTCGESLEYFCSAAALEKVSEPSLTFFCSGATRTQIRCYALTSYAYGTASAIGLRPAGPRTQKRFGDLAPSPAGDGQDLGVKEAEEASSTIQSAILTRVHYP